MKRLSILLLTKFYINQVKSVDNNSFLKKTHFDLLYKALFHKAQIWADLSILIPSILSLSGISSFLSKLETIRNNNDQKTWIIPTDLETDFEPNKTFQKWVLYENGFNNYDTSKSKSTILLINNRMIKAWVENVQLKSKLWVSLHWV